MRKLAFLSVRSRSPPCRSTAATRLPQNPLKRRQTRPRHYSMPEGLHPSTLKVVQS